jgi:hypothetical protein
MIQYLNLLPHIAKRSDNKYPKECYPQPSEECFNDLWAIRKKLHQLAFNLGSGLAKKEIIDRYKNESYNGRAPESLKEIKQTLESSTRCPVELAMENVSRFRFTDNFYRTKLKDELNELGARGCDMINPWIFEISEPNGKKGRDPKPNILQVAIRGVIRDDSVNHAV